MSNNKETPEVKELTDDEIIDRYLNFPASLCHINAAKWAKSRSDEYWKQEIAKKDLRIAELERKMEEKDAEIKFLQDELDNTPIDGG